MSWTTFDPMALSLLLVPVVAIGVLNHWLLRVGALVGLAVVIVYFWPLPLGENLVLVIGSTLAVVAREARGNTPRLEFSLAFFGLFLLVANGVMAVSR